MELLNLIGEGAQIGDMNAEDVAALSGRQAFSLLLPDGRVVVLIGLTSEEARGCLPGFMAPARFTVSAAGCLTCIEQSVQGLQMLIDAKDIAAELQLKRPYVVRRVLTRPDFPRPALELSRKVRKWSREEFERWLSDHYKRS